MRRHFILTHQIFTCTINKGARFYANAPSSSSPSSLLPLFRSFIVGRFDNAAQIARERARGSVEHPLAVHVSDVANQKIDGLPAGFAGVFVLEVFLKAIQCFLFYTKAFHFCIL